MHGREGRREVRADQIIKRPIVLTEKANALRGQSKVLFEVNREADKGQIRRAIEEMFSVQVVEINTLIMRGKERRMGRGYAKMQNWKKAIVTLKAGQTIDFFDSTES